MQPVRHEETRISTRLAPFAYPAFVKALDAEKVASARWVYLLSDPREVTLVRYVGCSFRVGTRYREHVIEARNPSWRSNLGKVLFIQQLLCDGLLPELLLVESVPAGVDHTDREEYWIEKFRTPALTNFWRPPGPPATDADFSSGWGGGSFW